MLFFHCATTQWDIIKREALLHLELKQWNQLLLINLYRIMNWTTGVSGELKILNKTAALCY